MAYRKILLVDDDAEDAEIFVMAINAIDPTIKCVVENNALDALKKLTIANKHPDVIFLDFYMPYLDGGSFLKLLREIKGLKKIPVVLYSGHFDANISEVTTRFKNIAFVEKSSSFKDIIETLKVILDQKS